MLEALDAGRPLVSTSVGIDGLSDLVGRGVLVADEPAQFAEKVVELLTSPTAAEEAGRTGSRAVRERYAWDAVLRPWLDRLDRLDRIDRPDRVDRLDRIDRPDRVDRLDRTGG